MSHSGRSNLIRVGILAGLVIMGSVWYATRTVVVDPIVAPTTDAGTIDPIVEPIASVAVPVKEEPITYLTHPAGEDLTEENIFVRVNNERAIAGLPPLTRNPKLDEAAREKLQDMLDKDYFAHDTPDGHATWIWFVKAGYTYTVAGENLARNFDTASATVAGWMASPTHKANILKEKYTETGVAVSGSMVVQEFGKPQ